MKKRQQRSVTIKGQRSKSSLHSHAMKSRQLIQRHQANHTCHPFQSNPTNWYQLKKRAKQRLRALSNGKIQLVTDIRFSQMYYGHHIRHWLQDSKTEHIFRASLKEVALIGAEGINPFINQPIDMDHYGSVGAIQEHVLGMSSGLVEFSADNELRGIDDEYSFSCSIHQHYFIMTFSQFLSGPSDGCGICQFNRL
ncbi:hypothetical protein P9J64_16695 [Deltaproteobacteria bacterium IMCC39524]|nr:hypothetical protein [Deltaproteobacteria bacterium IMCC39524]